MKDFIKGISLPELTWKQRAIVWYFILSLCSMCVSDDTPLWIVALLVLNFANAARLLKTVPISENPDDDVEI